MGREGSVFILSMTQVQSHSYFITLYCCLVNSADNGLLKRSGMAYTGMLFMSGFMEFHLYVQKFYGGGDGDTDIKSLAF
jgi:hypothetical protein